MTKLFLKILIVNDNVLIQLALKGILMNLNCLIDTSDNSQMALNQCDQNRYDLILMDLRLHPDDLTGFELSTEIKTQSLLNQETPIVALTADVRTIFDKQIKQAGMVGIISYPLTQEKAIELLESITSISSKNP